MKVTAVKVDPFTISTWCWVHCVLSRFKPPHSFPPPPERWGGQGGKHKFEATVRKKENYRDPSSMSPSSSPRRSTRTQPKGILLWRLQSAMKCCPSGILPRILPSHSTSLASRETPILSSKPNSTIFSPSKTFLVQHQREQIIPLTAYLWALHSISSCTKYTIADHLPRVKHCSTGTRYIALNKMDKELIATNK